MIFSNLFVPKAKPWFQVSGQVKLTGESVIISCIRTYKDSGHWSLKMKELYSQYRIHYWITFKLCFYLLYNNIKTRGQEYI